MSVLGVCECAYLVMKKNLLKEPHIVIAVEEKEQIEKLLEQLEVEQVIMNEPTVDILIPVIFQGKKYVIRFIGHIDETGCMDYELFFNGKYLPNDLVKVVEHVGYFWLAKNAKQRVIE